MSLSSANNYNVDGRKDGIKSLNILSNHLVANVQAFHCGERSLGMGREVAGLNEAIGLRYGDMNKFTRKKFSKDFSCNYYWYHYLHYTIMPFES